MIVIHYPSAFKALDEYIDSYNFNAAKHSEKIRSGAILTARELVRIYGISLLKASSLPGFSKSNLPSLQTNNEQLADLVKCSSRSIQRYIKKLLSAGVITAKKFRGSNANYELWMKPEILALGEKICVDNSKAEVQVPRNITSNQASETAIYPGQTSGCPHSYSGNFKKNIIITVDSVENSKSSGNTSGNTRKIALENFASKEKEGSAAAAVAPGDDTRKIASQVDKSNGPGPVVYDPTCDNFQSLYVRLFWMMARNLLYKDRVLTQSQVDIAQKLIYNFYAPLKPDEIDAIHKIYIERLSLVSKYLAKDPGKRFIPLPYIYFDAKNQHGFVGTRHWYRKHMKRKKEVMLELALGNAIKKFTSNERKEPLKRKPQLTVFRECENALGKLSDRSLLDRFHAAVLEHQGYSLLNQHRI